MKKVFTVALSLILLLSLCSCDKSSNTPNIGGSFEFNNTMEDFTIDIDPIEGPVGATIGFENTMEDFTVNIDPFDNPVGATINFEFTMEDFIIDIEPITVEPHSIELNLSFSDIDFNIEPVKVSNNVISFEFADFDFSIDESSFDVSQFAEESAVNFSNDVQVEIATMDVQQVVAIAETRANLLADLSYAFQTSGLDVIVDEELGEIILDSSVLFDVDEAEISDEGKAFLQKFLTVYTTVVFNEKYDGFLSHVLVEGHTDSVGDYDYNKTLSQNRADSVLAFCLSEESGTGDYAAELESSLEAVGYSYDRLIYDANGKEDQAASRRVSFRFLIALPE